MKPKTLIILVVLLALFTVFLPTLQAQRQILLYRVDVPFDFVAEGVHLPSGTYLVFRTAPQIINMVSKDGRASALVHIQHSDIAGGEGRNQLVFNRYGDAKFLAQVRSEFNQQIQHCSMCPMELNLAAKYQGPEVGTVLVAAK